MRNISLAFMAAGSIVLVGLGATTAVADGETVVRPGDLNTTDTRATGHVDFLDNGLHVWTEGATSTDKAAGYFAMGPEFPTSGGITWFGTSPAPGAQLVFDFDNITGNGNDYNLLVGESVYGDNWWLTNGSSAAAKAADPSAEQNGGNGSEWFGTLAQWKAAMPDATVYAGGFSLGSGIKGDGVVADIHFDDNVFTFTGQAAPMVVDVTGDFVATKDGRKAKVVMTSDAQLENTVLGGKLNWKIRVDGDVVFKTAQGFGDEDTWQRKFPKGTGKHIVQVFKDGELVKQLTVHTN